MTSIFDLFWLFLIFSSLAPVFQQRMLTYARLELLRRLERSRKSRVITMIHRQETMSILGFPVVRYIDIEDSELVLQAIRLTPAKTPIDLILHTPGGLVLAAGQIAHALAGHPGKVTVFVPHYAMSGGTLIALAADEVVLDENAVLGPVDPQLGAGVPHEVGWGPLRRSWPRRGSGTRTGTTARSSWRISRARRSGRWRRRSSDWSAVALGKNEDESSREL
jgi:ClpP class serine protease